MAKDYLCRYYPQSNNPSFLKGLLHNAISNNICQIVLGKRFDYDDKNFKKMIRVVINS